ncbi:hypothetical protein EC988_007484, partial [Linderina pennispora]
QRLAVGVVCGGCRGSDSAYTDKVAAEVVPWVRVWPVGSGGARQQAVEQCQQQCVGQPAQQLVEWHRLVDRCQAGAPAQHHPHRV